MNNFDNGCCYRNSDGTGSGHSGECLNPMSQIAKEEKFMSGSSTWSVCFHENGWFQFVKFFFLKCEVFCCKDCERLIEAEIVRKLRDYQLKQSNDNS